MPLTAGHDPLPRDHPLAGCEAKLLRAHQNLKLLDDELSSYTDRQCEPISRIGKLDPETKRHIRWDVAPVEQPDISLAAVIGDYIHDLRSALDHIAFELSFRDTGGVIPNRKIAWPCCRTRKEWVDARYKMKGINGRHRAMIYQTQPCYRRKDEPASPRTIIRRPRHGLADLEAFWNDDKHRTLQPVASVAFEIRGEITAIRDCRPRGRMHLERSVFGRPLKEGSRVFWTPVHPQGPNPEMEMDIQAPVTVTFSNGLPVVRTLTNLGNWVRKVVEYFIPQFEDRKSRQLWGLPRGSWLESVPILMKTTMIAKEAGGPWVQAPSRP